MDKRRHGTGCPKRGLARALSLRIGFRGMAFSENISYPFRDAVVCSFLKIIPDRSQTMPSLSTLAELYGCPFYLYDESTIEAQWKRLSGSLPDFSLLYSLKTNPHLDICRFMRECGAGADAASAGEVQQALAQGFSPDMILYSAPGKNEDDLEFGLENSMVIADSYGELERMDALAEAMARVFPVGLRINPALSFGPGPWPEILPGTPAKFGVDEESLHGRADYFAGFRHIRITGIHVFLRSQVLSHQALVRYWRHIFSLADKCGTLFGQPLEFINFGGGFGVACGEWTSPLDLAAFEQDLASLAAAERRRLPEGVQLFAESGRFLVASAGTFVTRVEDVKESRGTVFVIVPGALNAFFRPALMNLLGGQPGGGPGPLEPLYSNATAHQVFLPELSEEEIARRPLKRVTVTGNLCTSLDVVARDVLLPLPERGDILAIDNAGAYAASLSPHGFAGFERPRELYRDKLGMITV